MFRKQEDSMARCSVPKWKYVVTILMLLIAGAILGIYSSIERQLEKSFHQMWLEEEIPYPVESEYTMLTATSMVGYGLYAIGLDQSSLLYQPLHYLNRIAYESAMKKIPEDDSIREWFYYYRYYAVPIAKNDLSAAKNIKDLLNLTERLMFGSSKSKLFQNDIRFLFITGIFTYLMDKVDIVKSQQAIGLVEDLMLLGMKLFSCTASYGCIEGNETRIFPFKVSFTLFQYTFNRGIEYYKACNQDAYKHFVILYIENMYILQKSFGVAIKDQHKINEEIFYYNIKLRDALAELAWSTCQINLDKMEREYEQSRRSS